jgi:hypothetical protein
LPDDRRLTPDRGELAFGVFFGFSAHEGFWNLTMQDCSRGHKGVPVNLILDFTGRVFPMNAVGFGQLPLDPIILGLDHFTLAAAFTV